MQAHCAAMAAYGAFGREAWLKWPIAGITNAHPYVAKCLDASQKIENRRSGAKDLYRQLVKNLRDQEFKLQATRTALYEELKIATDKAVVQKSIDEVEKIARDTQGMYKRFADAWNALEPGMAGALPV